MSKHVLADIATDVGAIHDEMAARLGDDVIARVVDAVPEDWLEPAAGLDSSDDVRAAYRAHLRSRRDNPSAWLPGGLT